MSNVLRFTPKPLSNAEYMQKYREECARTGAPASPDKCKPGDAGTFTTAEGDVMAIGQCSEKMIESLQFQSYEAEIETLSTDEAPALPDDR